jgi:hypothetical protein
MYAFFSPIQLIAPCILPYFAVGCHVYFHVYEKYEVGDGLLTLD